jgi:hypothetical protein
MVWESRFVFFAKTVVFSAVFMIICACSTVKTSSLPPDQLRHQIASGELIQKGDQVTIYSFDGKKHDLKIIAVIDDSVWGNENVVKEVEAIDENAVVQNQVLEKQIIKIPIVDIVSIESREATGVGYVGAVAAGVGVAYLLYFLLPTLLVGLAVGGQ